MIKVKKIEIKNHNGCEKDAYVYIEGGQIGFIYKDPLYDAYRPWVLEFDLPIDETRYPSREVLEDNIEPILNEFLNGIAESD